MLRNAAGFAGRHIGFADGVEQRSLAVVHVTHDGNNRGTRDLEFAGVLGLENFFDRLVCQFFFVADHGCAGAKLGGNIFHHCGVERLVHGDEYTAHQKCGDQVLGANLELLGQVLHADAFGYGDFARDRQGLVAEVCGATKTRRRHKALHRAFLGLGILLAATAGAILGRALRTRRLAGRRSTACARSRTAKAAGTRSAESGACPECRTPTGCTGAAGACKSGAGWVLGSWTAAGELPGRSTGTRRPLLESAAGCA